jgi:hypothetical protein
LIDTSSKLHIEILDGPPLKVTTLAIAAAVFTGAASITFAIVRWLEQDADYAFAAGAILATQIAAIIHYRTPGSTNTIGVKAMLGAVLSLTALLFGLLLNAWFSPFKFADISIPIATLGAFGFPFVLFGTMWNALSKSKRS